MAKDAPDLFGWDEVPFPVRAGELERTRGELALEIEQNLERYGDPFGAGSGETPEPDPNELAQLGNPLGWVTATPKERFDANIHYDRTYRVLAQRWPGKYWKAERTAIKWVQQVPVTYTVDLLGFADVQGVMDGGRASFWQICAPGQVAAHLRDFTNPANTHGQARTPVERHIRDLLELGALLGIISFTQERKGGHWEPHLLEITSELLDAVKARKRGTRKR